MSEEFSGITGSDGGRGRTWVGGGKRRFGGVLERIREVRIFMMPFLNRPDNWLHIGDIFVT